MPHDSVCIIITHSLVLYWYKIRHVIVSRYTPDRRPSPIVCCDITQYTIGYAATGYTRLLLCWRRPRSNLLISVEAIYNIYLYCVLYSMVFLTRWCIYFSCCWGYFLFVYNPFVIYVVMSFPPWLIQHYSTLIISPSVLWATKIKSSCCWGVSVTLFSIDIILS